MERETTIARYQRVSDWQHRATLALLADMRERGACDPIPLTLHNWGRCAGQEPYRTLDRLFRYRQAQIDARAKRLRAHYARAF